MKTIIFIILLLPVVCFAQTNNDVTLKEYVDAKTEANKAFVDAQITNINDNVIRANVAMEKRLDALNEFRGQLKDQAATFITRAELVAWIGMLAGIFFGIAAYMRGRKQDSNAHGSNIVSGDKVEVKK